MTDKLGVPLHIDDKVAYTTGTQGNDWIEIGTLVSFKQDYQGREVAEIRSERGRMLSNSRPSNGLVSIMPITIQHPELFI